MAKSFSLQLAEFAKKAGGNADDVIRKVGIEVFSSVVKKTPVDTGRARGAWVVSFGSPATGFGSPDPGAYGTRPGVASAASAEAALRNFTAGPSIWITNNLPYIQRLENGYSTQTPPNAMVGLTVSQYQNFVRNAVRALP